MNDFNIKDRFCDFKIVFSDNEDLKLIINKENFYSATLNNLEGFGYMWAGVRATYGYEKGKLFYQVKVVD